MRNKIARATGVAAAALGVVVVAGSIVGGIVLTSGGRAPTPTDSTVNVSNDQGGATDGQDEPGGAPTATTPARHDDGPGTAEPESGSAEVPASECAADDDADHEAGDAAQPGDDGPDSDDDC